MAKRGTRLAAPFARHPLSLVRGEGGEPRRPQHDRRPHWSTRLAWVGLRKNWRGEKSPLNSCGCGREKLESAQPASSARRFSVQTFPVVSSSSSSLSSSIFRILPDRSVKRSFRFPSTETWIFRFEQVVFYLYVIGRESKEKRRPIILRFSRVSVKLMERIEVYL